MIWGFNGRFVRSTKGVRDRPLFNNRPREGAWEEQTNGYQGKLSAMWGSGGGATLRRDYIRRSYRMALNEIALDPTWYTILWAQILLFNSFSLIQIWRIQYKSKHCCWTRIHFHSFHSHIWRSLMLTVDFI